MAGALLAASVIGNKVVLSGTSGVPNVSQDSGITDPSGAVVSAGWRFLNTGGVNRKVAGAWVTWSPAPAEWHRAPGVDYWIRFTLDSGSSPDTGTFGTWQKLHGTSSADREFSETETAGPFGSYIRSGTVKVEIATDAGGTNIVATGYYKYDVEATP